MGFEDDVDHVAYFFAAKACNFGVELFAGQTEAADGLEEVEFTHPVVCCVCEVGAAHCCVGLVAVRVELTGSIQR